MDIYKGPCPFFEIGDEFTVNYLTECPETFKCDWA
jgi:uncharacterized repeat protein (TIGR04076 family)